MSSTRSDANTRTVDILIVGAGIAGTALASFLLQAQLKSPSKVRFRITILERSPAIQGHGQNIDIRGPGKELLRKLGIDDEVRAATTGEEGAMFVDSAGKAWASFAVDKSGKVETPTGEIEILRGRLSKLLFESASDLSEQMKKSGGDGVEFIFRESIDRIEQQQDKATNEGKVRVRYSKSQEWREFDLVVGADGLQSRTRSLAWTTMNDEPEGETANQIQAGKDRSTTGDGLRQRAPLKSVAGGLVSNCAEQERHTGNKNKSSINASPQNDLLANANPYIRPLDVYTAFFSIPTSLIQNAADRTNKDDNVNDGWRRWYHIPGRKSVMLRPSDDKSRLTVLMNVLDLERKDSRLPATAVIKGDRKMAVLKQKELMREYFEDGGWECAKLVEGMQAADDFYYDIVAQVKMDQWYRSRVCLLGDAAHCPSPFSGMGTTLALVGAYNLAGSLTKQMSSRQSSPINEAPNSSLPASSLTDAFSEYEFTTRPIVTKAQQLPPGMPWILHPQTGWGLFIFHYIMWSLYLSGLDKVLAKLAGRFKGKAKQDGLIEWGAQ